MKNVGKLLIVVMFLSLGAKSFGQVKFGVKAGLNLANMTIKSDLATSDTKMKMGIHLGGVGEYALSDVFSVEAGLLFSTKGAKFTFDGEDGSGNVIKITETLGLNYLEIPINAIYKKELSGLKIFGFAGPYLGYALSGKSKSDEAGSKDYTIKFGSKKATATDPTSGDDMKGLDFGLNIGAGVDIKGITISLQYGLGLSNLAVYTDGGNTEKNKVIGISVGYKFGGK